jgi:hypothetical protein
MGSPVLELMAWVQLDPSTSAGAVIAEIREARPGGNFNDHATDPLTLTTSWEPIELLLDLHATPLARDTTALRIETYWDGFPSNTQCFLVDDVAFRACD